MNTIDVFSFSFMKNCSFNDVFYSVLRNCILSCLLFYSATVFYSSCSDRSSWAVSPVSIMLSSSFSINLPFWFQCSFTTWNMPFRWGAPNPSIPHSTVLSCSVVSQSLKPLGLYPTMLFCPWQGYWSWLSCPPPRDHFNPGIEPRSPTLQADSLLSEPPGKPRNTGVGSQSLPQELNWHLLHYRQILHQLSYQGSPQAKLILVLRLSNHSGCSRHAVTSWTNHNSSSRLLPAERKAF